MKHSGVCSDLEGYTFNFWCPLFSRGGSEVYGKFSFALPTFSGGGLISVFSSLSYTSDLEIYLGTPFLMVLSRLTVSNVIGEGSKVVGGSSQSFPRKLAWILSSAWSIDHVGSLRSCLWVDIFLHSRLTGSLGYLYLIIPDYRRVSEVLRRTDLLSWAIFLEVSPSLLF